MQNQNKGLILPYFFHYHRSTEVSEMNNYSSIIQQNLDKLYNRLPRNFAHCIQGVRQKDRFTLDAFGTTCRISPTGIDFDSAESDVFSDPIPSLLVSMYALNATDTSMSLTPLKAFKEFPDSMPYAGAFATHTEQLLVPHVDRIKTRIPRIMNHLKGKASPTGTGGDFSFVVHPLPKIALCYIFYEADDDFPAGVTCLYSANARHFMPVDGLADVGEYTSKRLIGLVQAT